jgi:dihydrofolate reductase
MDQIKSQRRREMRKVIIETRVSLDGVQENPQLFVFDYVSEESTNYVKEQLFRSDALLMGRVTYEGFAKAWPTRTGDEFSDRMNSLPKYVASRTLQEKISQEPLTWNAQLLKGDVTKEVAKLKEQPGQDILQYGIGELTHTLIQQGLVDELRFLIFPVAIGRGQRIFETFDKTALKLLETKTFKTGVVALHYQPVKNKERDRGTL